MSRHETCRPEDDKGYDENRRVEGVNSRANCLCKRPKYCDTPRLHGLRLRECFQLHRFSIIGVYLIRPVILVDERSFFC